MYMKNETPNKVASMHNLLESIALAIDSVFYQKFYMTTRALHKSRDPIKDTT